MKRWLLLSGGFVTAALLTAGLAFGQTGAQPKAPGECSKKPLEKVEGQVTSVDAERNTATFALPHGRGDCAKRVSEGGGSATRRHRPDQARSRRHRSTIGPIALTGGSLGGGGIATSRNAGVYAWRRLEP